MSALKIDLKGSLDDCNLTSYAFSREDILYIEIETWNYKKLLLIFNKPIMFIDHGCGGAVEFCYGPVDAPIVQQAIARHYAKVPEEHPYKLFQLFGFSDNPSYEIVCKDFEEKLFPCSLSQVAMELSEQLKSQVDIHNIAHWASTYLVEHIQELSFELRELLHCISLMKVYPQLSFSKEELLLVVEETYIDVNDFGKPRPKPTTKKIIDRTYRFIHGL